MWVQNEDEDEESIEKVSSEEVCLHMKCLYRLAGFQTDPPSLLKREKILSLDLNFGPQVCRYEACLASQMHLRTIGLPKFADSPSLGKVMQEPGILPPEHLTPD